MTARTVLQLAAGVVSGTLTGVVVNLATADGASPLMWLAVVAATLVGVAAAVWAASGNGGSGAPDDRSTRSGGGAENHGGGPVLRERPGQSPAAVAAVVLVAVGAGLAFGLAYGADRGPHRGPEGPNDGVPTTAVSTPPTESAVGAWLSIDNTFETLHLDADGTYRWENPPGADRSGRYRLEGSRLVFLSGEAAGQAFTWSVRDALLTLTDDDSGAQRLYTRN